MRSKIIIIGLFGFFGAITRVIVSELLEKSMESHIIIIIINTLGSFLLGFGLEYGKSLKNSFFSKNHLEILSGFVGSMTTFSMLEFSLYEISKDHYLFYAVLWIITELFLGLALFKWGEICAKKIMGKHQKDINNKEENYSALH